MTVITVHTVVDTEQEETEILNPVPREPWQPIIYETGHLKPPLCLEVDADAVGASGIKSPSTLSGSMYLSYDRTLFGITVS